MFLKKVIILLIIISFLLAAFFSNKYLQKKIRPRESFRRLILYFASCMLVIFLFSLVMVFIITRLFPGELIK